MPNYRRVYTSRGLYFFTVVTFGRRPFLTTDLARRCPRSVWQEVQKKLPFQTEAVCLLPDYVQRGWYEEGWGKQEPETIKGFLLDHAFVLVPAQAYVGQFLATFKDYPPRQKAASFSIDQVLEMMQEAPNS